MALNPDDLLIFKVREGDKPEVSKEKKKPAVVQPAQVQQAPTPLPQPIEQKPVPVQKPQEQPQPRKPFFQMPKRQPKPEPKPAPIPEPVQRFEPEDEGDYYIAPPEYIASPADVVNSALEVAGVEKPKKDQKAKKERDPRKIAQHMSCELHPWRRAYAICNYCKRAFCYEDIVESGGKYYCLDDIEKVPESQRRSQMIRYNNLGLLSSVLFMLVFLVFFYYTYPQMIVVIGNLQKLGMTLFIADITNSELFLIAETVAVVASFVTAILILLNDPRSFRVSSIDGITTVVLFLYEYIYVDKIYFIAIAGMSFIALVTLAYSRVSYESLSDAEELPNIDVAKSSSF